MTQLVADRSIHQTHFSKEIVLGNPLWLEQLRKSASDHFDAVGFPTLPDALHPDKPRLEEWRFTNKTPAFNQLVKTKFLAPPPSHNVPAIEGAMRFGFGNDALTELVFINGHYTPQLSKLGHLPRGTIVASLAESLALPEVQANLSHLADFNLNPFVALNTGSIVDGVFIHLPRNAAPDGPIHLLFVSVASDQPTVTHPRVLVFAEENTEATIVETYAGEGTSEGSGAYLTNAVTEIVQAPSSRIDHCKIQMELPTAWHIALMNVRLGHDARFVSHSINTGGLLTRNEVGVVLAGEHADATINGLVLMDGQRHCDNHTLLDHAAAHCPSHELYKHVLADQSSGVFKGKILVRPDSQKTDSKQTSKVLLLSEEAQMNSMPALEIYADDVKCTHGSTTGPVDEEQVFYLRSRGISLEAARHLMTYAFAADITRRIKVAPVRSRIENFMAAQHGLPQDLRITDLGGADEAVVNA
jgi:Fe-S cluster assembly protein SufD